MSFFHAGPAPKGFGPRPGALRDGLTLHPGMKVGLFGGSFNPAHDGHAHVAETAMRRLGLDRVVWLVSPQNPLKDARHSAPLAQRMASARLQAHGPSMVVSDFETRAGVVWTVDTLRLLVARHPGVRFVWLMGSDNLVQFSQWDRWREIAARVPIGVLSRPGTRLAARLSKAARVMASSRLPARRAGLLGSSRPPAWVMVDMPMSNASSSAIRAAKQAASGMETGASATAKAISSPS